ncbi:hypothetical protein ACQ5SO_07890 [Rhodovulum sp. DZ06]|uniref:hypothetical protein n=1 Tax=Rhodovulum sp. DZ06 TaxID=3425126 RepID=UPI003D32D6F9
MPSPRYFVAFGVLVPLCALACIGGKGLIDDTLITLVYARNWVELGLPLWHEKLPPVEGFTSLGHTAMLAGLIRLGLAPMAAVVAIQAAGLALLALLFLRATRKAGAVAALLGLAVLLFNQPMLTWLRGGLDAVPYAVAFFGVYLAYRDALGRGRLGPAFAACAAALILLRPEGALVSAGLLAHFALVQATARSTALGGSTPPARPAPPAPAAARAGGATDWRAFAVVALGLAALVGALTLWRLDSFGQPLPNTFYAKRAASHLSELGDGVRYVHGWLLLGGGLLTLATLANVQAGVAGARLRLMFIAGQVAVVIAAGGDSHHGFRFMLPVVPLLAIDVALLLDRLRGRLRVGLVALLALAATRQDTLLPSTPPVLRGVATLMAEEPSPQDRLLGRFLSGSRIGAEKLAEILPPGAAVAADDVGALALYTRLPVLDGRGLNHAGMAHAPKDPERRNKWGTESLGDLLGPDAPAVQLWFPRAMPWRFPAPGAETPDCTSEAEVMSRRIRPIEAELQAAYLCVSIPAGMAEGETLWLNTLLRRDRPDLLSALPGGSAVSDCHALLAQLCPREE